ncbi:MAG: NAD(P)-dependent alcohol dehydrogenase [Ferruginibacter sp.]|nr:NAD(P)-dependent alcohol dehydrogenase [Ferruginibacter sp.]
MKAIVYTKYGGPKMLHLQETPTPSPKKDEVLIRVEAASINDWDLGLVEGDLVNRVINGLVKPKRQIVGSDIAGIVETTGAGVTRFKVGDAVYGDLSGRWGGFAEYVCASETCLALKPASMSFVDAAAIPQAAMLAVQAIIDVGQLQAGQKLLINGAGGGVGSFGIQLAKLHGVKTTGVDHTSKLAFMRSIGFDHVIDYTKEDFTKNGQQYDLIVDAKTNRSMFAYTKSLVAGGKYVTVGGSMKHLLQLMLLRSWISKVHHIHLCLVSLKTNRDLPYINELFEAGKIKPNIHGTYRLENFREAFHLFAAGQHKGKVVITMHEH